MMKKSLGLFILIGLFTQNAVCKEVFKIERVAKYLTKENPYVYSAVGQQYVDEARVQTSMGAFDTKLSSQYDNKEYPLSDGRYLDLSLAKPTENGTEFLAGYRKAEGVQEYNNIKTGDEGEFRVGIKVPVFALLNDMNFRKYSVGSASLGAVQSKFEAQNNLRNLYSNVFISYYTLLYYNELFKLEKTLLSKANKRNEFTQKRVLSGDLPEVAQLESEQQIINRKQRILITQNSYHNAFQIFLKYLNLPKKHFDSRYDLPSLPMLKKNTMALQTALTKALEKRPDLKVLEYKKMKLELESDYNKLSKYPDLSVSAYGVHDLRYGSGTKVSFNLDFPLERTGYEGKKVEIKRGIAQLDEEQNKLKLELKTNLTNLLYSLDVLSQNIKNAQEEIGLVEELEKVENKKYRLGSSNLFQVNQREIYTLQTKQKQLEYYLNVLLIQQDIKREMGELFDL
ncbi:TolC family protein [Sulfurovum sp.]|uniref:TolC family protein n=1 Tax=Sulfurovum sp. TaxID=1969726 RepID=UPI002867EE8D|nr:TolC family protein [Sulfurovum sp.]